jgi:ATP-dependent DNA ligase
MAAAALPTVMEKLVQNADARGSVSAAAGGHPSVLEPKYDGWRTIWKVGDDGVARFYTRSGQDLTGRWPAVEAMIAAACPPGTVLDGEAVQMETINGVLVPRWGGVQSILGSGVKKAALQSGSLTLVLFDLIAHGGIDARSLTLEQRRAALEAVYAQAGFDPMKVMLSEHLDPTEENHARLVEAGYEGSMVKWLDAPYKSGVRGAGWWKLKASDDEDAIVIGYKDGDGGFTGLIGSIIFGQYTKDGRLVPRGACSGMTMQERVRISKNRDAYLSRVFSFRHMGLQAPTIENPLGAFRHPQFKTWRPDKPAEAVIAQ